MGQGLGLVRSESEFLPVTCPVSVVCVSGLGLVWSGTGSGSGSDSGQCLGLVWPGQVKVRVRVWSASGFLFLLFVCTWCVLS